MTTGVANQGRTTLNLNLIKLATPHLFYTVGPDTEPVLRSGTAAGCVIAILKPHLVVDPPLRASFWGAVVWPPYNAEFKVIESRINRLNGFMQCLKSLLDARNPFRSRSTNQFNESAIC